MEDDRLSIQATQEDQQPSERTAPVLVEQGDEDEVSRGDIGVPEEDREEKQRLSSRETDRGDDVAQTPGQPQPHRQQYSPGHDPESAIKFLVPNYLAGSLIGKKGATIKDIQVKTSCMVRIATSGMYFPGTMERAVLVAGNSDGVERACALILHTIHAPDHNISGCAKLLSPELAAKIDVSQRMLIPLTAGGLVIGRKGANIAALLEASRAKMTLGQKAEIKANERLVTVQGKLPHAVKAVEMLLAKLREEPLLSRFSNLSVSYRGHGSGSNKAVTGAGIAPTSEPYPRAARGSIIPVVAPIDAGLSSTTPSAFSAASGVTDADVAAAASGDTNSGSRSPAKSSSSNATSPPRLASPEPALHGVPAWQMDGRGMGASTGGRFQQQQHQQQPFRQSMRHPMQHQHHHQHPHPHTLVHQHHHQHRIQHQQQHPHQAYQFHQQPHPHQQHFSISPSRGPQPQQSQQPQPHSPPPQQQQQQPPQPMMQITPAGPMMASSPDHQMGVMTPLGPIMSNPPTMHRMGVAYGSPPASAGAYFPGGMPAPGVTAAVGRGVDGQQPSTRGGYVAIPPPLPGPPQQQQQQVMMPLEAPVTNPIAAAVATCPPITSVTVGVPNSMIGAILGRGGATIAELQSMSGARINVSQRDDLVPGTDSRLLTISGTPMATQAAQYLVSQKIQEIADRRREVQAP